MNTFIRSCIVTLSLTASLSGITFETHSIETRILLPELTKAIEVDKRTRMIVDDTTLRQTPLVPSELFIGKLAELVHECHTQPRTLSRCCTFLGHSTKHGFPLLIAYNPHAKMNLAVAINYPFIGDEYAAALELVLDFILADSRAPDLITTYTACISRTHSESETAPFEFQLPLEDQLAEFKQALFLFVSFPQVQLTLKAMGLGKELQEMLSAIKDREKRAADKSPRKSATVDAAK